MTNAKFIGKFSKIEVNFNGGMGGGRQSYYTKRSLENILESFNSNKNLVMITDALRKRDILINPSWVSLVETTSVASDGKFYL